MKCIAFIGAGGINSWAIKHLFDISEMFKQVDTLVKIFDNDIIEEKNVRHRNQNFDIEDLMKQKSKVLAERYSFLYEEIFITKDNLDLLDMFDDIIIGVDNHKTRQLIYEYCLEKGKYLLDLRAQGTLIAFYILDHKKDMEYYNKKFFSNKNIMEKKGSCQLDFDVQNDNYQNGNKIIALMGICGIYLKHLRGEEVTTNEYKFVY